MCSLDVESIGSAGQGQALPLQNFVQVTNAATFCLSDQPDEQFVRAALAQARGESCAGPRGLRRVVFERVADDARAVERGDESFEAEAAPPDRAVRRDWHLTAAAERGEQRTLRRAGRARRRV